MATSFDSVIDMALVIIRDYKLDALYESDANAFKTLLEGYMLKGLSTLTNVHVINDADEWFSRKDNNNYHYKL